MTEYKSIADSIRFQKDGFYIISCDINGEKATVLGNCPYSIKKGEEIKFKGTLTSNKKYGLQCKADIIEIILPTEEDMIVSYLKKSKIAGLGGATAEKIFATFGSQTFSIIDENPDRLMAVSGIGRKKLVKIVEGWKEKRNGPRIIDRLVSDYKLQTSQANNIYDAFKEKSLSIMAEEPFLAYQEEIIDFMEADSIHKIEKLDHLDPLRIMSGIIYILRSACSIEGHCSLPKVEVERKASIILGVSLKSLEYVLESDKFNKMIVPIKINNVDHYQLFSISKIEFRIASKIHRMLISDKKDFGDVDSKIDAEIKKIELTNDKIKISIEQRKAIKESLINNVNVINGGPGVGKTTIANQIIATILKNGYTCTLLAPTGRAAKRMTETTGQKAKTIHRLIAESEGTFFKSDFIIVDEFSMVDIFILDKLLSIVSDESNLIIIGDVDQIMSIGAGCVLRDIIDSEVINISKVKQIRRQDKDSSIITNAYKVNSGKMVEKGSKEEDFMFIETSSDARTIDNIKQMMESNIQSAFGFDPKTEVQILTPVHAGLTGTRNINILMQDMFNKYSSQFLDHNGRRFYVGDNIIQNKNDYERMVFNGDVGYIKSINNRSIRVVYPDHSDSEIIYKPEHYYQIDLSYAITPYKAQGSEFPFVILPISHKDVTLLDRSLLFTGITRGSKYVIIVGSRVNLIKAINRNRSDFRHTTLKDKLKLTFNMLNDQMLQIDDVDDLSKDVFDYSDINDDDVASLEEFILSNYKK